MDDQTSAFTYDNGFFESSGVGDDDVILTAIDALPPPDAMRIDDDIWTSNNAIDHHGSNILATTFRDEFSVEANVQGADSYRETLADTFSCEKSDRDYVAPVSRNFSEIEPKINDERNSAEPDTATSPVGMTENLDFKDSELGISQDPVCTSALDECPVKATPVADFLACEAAQDIQGEAERAEKAENDSVEAALEGKNPASDVVCPSSPRRNICRSMRPSRDVHPIDDSLSFVSAKRRHAPSLQPSRGVQPIMSQTLALSVVIEVASGPRAALPRVAESTALDFSLESVHVPRPESRKRAAAKEILKEAKRVRQSDEEDAQIFEYDYGSVQRKCTDLERDIDDLDIQLRREAKALQRRFRKEAQEAEDWFKKHYRDIAEKFQPEVHDLEDKLQSTTEALQQQLDTFKVDLRDAGLVNLDA
ncbi:hypothetical protein HO173_003302 [Letharia columbiana]|uniref:Uncharacterized protein n=1 Tax=Letharia columbiana TaxID=112416 RepID=A0A8H6G1V3_9LECA|nr:uncharacterized protein HO173_003302 [Letharia columbiana]KAF6238795.1 hypothetical protein HO173_003302 [Letharia columbiana]